MSQWHGFTGAGVLVYDVSTDEILLIKDYHGKYADMGGALHPPISAGVCPRTAAQELKEESRGVFDFKPSLFSKCQYVDVAGQYRMYILPLTHTNKACTRYYAADVKNMPSCYRETTGMTRFPMAQFRGKRVLNKSALTDTGKSVKLDDRVRAGLSKAFRTIEHLVPVRVTANLQA